MFSSNSIELKIARLYFFIYYESVNYDSVIKSDNNGIMDISSLAHHMVF